MVKCQPPLKANIKLTLRLNEWCGARIKRQSERHSMSIKNIVQYRYYPIPPRDHTKLFPLFDAMVILSPSGRNITFRSLVIIAEIPPNFLNVQKR